MVIKADENHQKRRQIGRRNHAPPRCRADVQIHVVVGQETENITIDDFMARRERRTSGHGDGRSSVEQKAHIVAIPIERHTVKFGPCERKGKGNEKVRLVISVPGPEFGSRDLQREIREFFHFGLSS